MAEQFIAIGTGGQDSGGTPNPTGLEADWVNRSTGNGVVWAHPFKRAEEVTNFLFPGSPTNLNKWRNDDLVGQNGCYEAVVPAGDLHHGGWERPFSPLLAGGNGLLTDDVALAGTLTKRNWVPGPNQLGQWAHGYYQHAQYQTTATHPQPARAACGQAPFGANGFLADNIPGSDFYLQFRVKIGPSGRFDGAQPDGKLVMLLISGDGPIIGTGQPRTPNQEIVIKSNPSRLYQMYTNFGNRSNSYLTSQQGSSGTGQYQPGAEYGATCVIGNTTTNTCMAWVPDQWHTVLIHVIPGQDGGGGDQPVVAGNPANNTGIEVWIQFPGEWQYRKIWEKFDYVFSFGQGDPWPMGFNAFAFNAFMNEVNATTAFYHRYTEAIFSRMWVPPAMPLLATVPTHFAAKPDLVAYTVAGGTGQKIPDVVPPSNLRPADDYSSTSICNAWTGASIDPEEAELLMVAKGGHVDGSGNDVYGLPLRQNTPVWRRLANPTVNVDPNDVEGSVAGTAYSDGKPRAYHGWNRDVFLAGRVWFEPEGTYKNGWRQTAQWSWNKRAAAALGGYPLTIAQSPYTSHGDPMPTKGGNMETQGGPSAPDPVSWRVWNVANQGANNNGEAYWWMHAGTLATGRLPLTIGQGGNGHINWAVVLDDLRVLVIGAEEGYINIINLRSPTTVIVATPSGTGAYISGVGAHYHRKSRAILCWDGYANFIRKLVVPANPLGTTGWAWSNVAVGGPTLPTTHDGTNRGAYGKFNMVENMGDGRSALVTYQNVNNAAYVIPLPFAGV